MKADVAIIGAGPAGAMAALQLADSGLRVVLLEKATLPRQKACGGGIPENALKDLNWDYRDVIENRATRMCYLNNFSMEKTVRISPPLLMVNRRRFDYELICHAAEKGKQDLRIRDRFPIERIEETQKTVRLKGANGEIISAEAVIAADGANSKAGRQLGLVRHRPEVFALDASVEVSPSWFEEKKTTATLNISCLSRGYGWIFPKNGYLSCGVGGLGVKRALPDHFDAFIRKSLPQGDFKVTRKRVHPVPIFTGRRRLATRRVCLAGDAAGLVDPIMGEGIRYALRSGAIAAQWAVAMIGGSDTRDLRHKKDPQSEKELPAYSEIIHRKIGAELDLLYRFAFPVFMEQPDFFYRKFFYESLNYLALCRGLAEKVGSSGRRRALLGDKKREGRS